MTPEKLEEVLSTLEALGSWDPLGPKQKEFRRMLWQRHGCRGLYGDDGEMQCGKCMLDFKRDSAEHISAVFHQKGLEAKARLQECLKKAQDSINRSRGEDD
jgi:hypothetical protein